jgi:hypothetical protein
MACAVLHVCGHTPSCRSVFMCCHCGGSDINRSLNTIVPPPALCSITDVDFRADGVTNKVIQCFNVGCASVRQESQAAKEIINR